MPERFCKEWQNVENSGLSRIGIFLDWCHLSFFLSPLFLLIRSNWNFWCNSLQKRDIIAWVSPFANVGQFLSVTPLSWSSRVLFLCHVHVVVTPAVAALSLHALPSLQDMLKEKRKSFSSWYGFLEPSFRATPMY